MGVQKDVGLTVVSGSKTEIAYGAEEYHLS